jgi:hypothetical protein
MTPGPRKKLGRNVTAMTREAIFETADAIEVESRAGYEVTRKRVLFEEVLLVTIHRAVGLPYVISLGLLAIIFGAVALAGFREPVVFITFGLLALPFLTACVVRLILKVDTVSVFGRRSKAVMRFAIHKRRAREVYGRICSRTSEVQRSMVAVEPAAPAPVEQPPLPPTSE